ncbi:EpsG family protein [Paenibacillus sp. sgz302251]|uniref:EpsG family protein n=1 Tax=Paenibacillus sp. sgz302251 TaxID=3414493 RepID=UPI003C7BCC9A
MTLLFYGVVIFLNIFAGIKYRNNIKINTNPLILFLSFIIVFLLMSGYRNTSGLSNDLLYTELEYKNIINGLVSNYEIGYVLLMKVGGIFTQDFYTFRSMIIGIFLLLLFWSIRKWAPSPHYVIALFSSYLVILSSEQLRYFLAFIIFVIGLLILLYSNYRHKKVIFSCFLLLASTIHFSFLVYFIFLLSDFSRKSIREKIIVSLTLLFCFIIFLNNNQIPGLSQLLESINNYKVIVYMNQSTNFGFLYPFVLHLSSILLTLWALRLTVDSKDNETIQIIRNVYKLNLLVVLFFPLFMLQLTFYRLARNLLIINYFVYSQIRISKKISFSKRKLFAFMVWNSVILWIVVDLFITTSAEALLVPFFTENIYFNF